MKEDYIVLDVTCPQELSEILIAELSMLAVESFLENESGFQCSFSQKNFQQDQVVQVLEKYAKSHTVAYSLSSLPDRDWNQLWESNFHPIVVENKVSIRAPFHPVPENVPYEILIQPKMSFGTGHHETTYMMIQSMLEIDFDGKRTLDIGCGTGILSIMAEKLGSGMVTGIDIDEWAISNANENISLNKCNKITVIQSSVRELDKKYRAEIILANINRNTLTEEFSEYAVRLINKGILVVSGFYESDESFIRKAAEENSCSLTGKLVRNGWSSIAFEKKSDYFS